MESTSEETTLAPAASPAPPKPESKGASIFETVMISLLMSAIAVFCYDHFFAQKIVVGDLNALSENLGEAVQLKVITIDEALARLDKAKEQVDKTRKNDVVLLSSVFLGKKDKYTFIDLPFVDLPTKPKTGATADATAGTLKAK